MERPSVELDVAWRAESCAIAVAISRFVTASAKPPARQAPAAVSIVRCDRKLQLLVASVSR
jgi:hypothetical protein